MSKKSFIIHHDSVGILEKLTDEQAGKLFKAICAYSITGEIDCDSMTDLLVHPFVNQLDRDTKKWNNKSMAGKENGKKGGRPNKAKQSQEKLNKANESQINLNKPVRVSVTASASGKVSASEGFKDTCSVIDDSEYIFDHWKAVMSKNEGAKFTPKRKKAVNDRIKDGYSVDDIKLAIDGCAKTPHNMGENDQRKRFDCLELICRSGENIERFKGNLSQVTIGVSSKSQQIHDSIMAVKL